MKLVDSIRSIMNHSWALRLFYWVILHGIGIYTRFKKGKTHPALLQTILF